MGIRRGEVLTVEQYTQLLEKVGGAFRDAVDIIYGVWESEGSDLAYSSRLDYALLIYGSNGEGVDAARPPKVDSDIDPELILGITGDMIDKGWWNGAILYEMSRILNNNPYLDDSHPFSGLTGLDYQGITKALESVRDVDKRNGVTIVAFSGSNIINKVKRAGDEVGINVNVFTVDL